MKNAYVTMLCHGDGYVPGVEALGRSLEASGTRVPRVAMVTADVSPHARDSLVSQGWTIRDIEPLYHPNPAFRPLFPRFEYVFAKLRAWELVEYDKVVLLDADTIVLQKVDELFERPEFAAAPDFLLPDRFNSGVMVLDPSTDTLRRMLDALSTSETYDGGDQGFLNSFFPDWYAMPAAHRLPVGYNLFHFIFQFMHAHPSLKETLTREARILHYAVQKPWQTPTVTGGSASWWGMYDAAHPEQTSPWRTRLHALEDWTFEHVVGAFVG